MAKLPSVIASFECVVLDCPDVDKLAKFYQKLIGGVINQPDPRWSTGDGWATLHAGRGLVLAFQRAASYQPPSWPDPDRPQQFHLDFGVQDLNQAEHQVLALGATLLDASDGNRGWRVFADPAGHPFCLVLVSHAGHLPD